MNPFYSITSDNYTDKDIETALALHVLIVKFDNEDEDRWSFDWEIISKFRNELRNEISSIYERFKGKKNLLDAKQKHEPEKWQRTMLNPKIFEQKRAIFFRIC